MKLKKLLLIYVLTAFSSLVAAQSNNNYEVQRTEWGQPDLQGVWNFSSDVPMQRPLTYGTQEFLSQEEIQERRDAIMAQRAAADEAAARLNIDPDAPEESSNPGGYNDFWFETAGLGDVVRTSHIVYPENGRQPDYVEGANRQFGGLGSDVPGDRPVRYVVGGIDKGGPEDRGLSERCIVGFNSGPPFVPSLYNNNMQIIQNKDTAVILTEMIHDARIVPMVDKPALADDIRLWSGDSRGYWDDEVLVVETRNFNGFRQTFGAAGDNYNAVLTEKFTRVAYDQVDYEFTIDDTSTFTDKITAVVPMIKMAGQVYEYACHEGNYGMINTLRGARVEERLAAEGVDIGERD